jgi:hypothetical protein
MDLAGVPLNPVTHKSLKLIAESVAKTVESPMPASIVASYDTTLLALSEIDRN